MKDNPDDDVLTRNAFLEIVELHKKLFKLSVEVNNKTYTTWDMCARGILPDIPDMPYMPCLTASPLHCFREAGEFNHPTYQQIDPIIDQLIPDAVPYATRPS